MTYRAAYWISADKQNSVVLTSEDQVGMSDADLLAAASTEAESAGLDIGDGEIIVGDWIC